MKSMTGSGFAEVNDGSYVASVECKTWNSKYTEYNLVLPQAYSGLEELCKQVIRPVILRGKLEAIIRFKPVDQDSNWSLDPQALSAAIQILGNIRSATGETAPIRTADILSFEGVLCSGRRMDTITAWAIIEPLLVAALQKLDACRSIEGQATCTDLLNQLRTIETALNKVSAKADIMAEQFKESLISKFREVVGDAIDENRVLQETAVMLARYSIHEEIQRLNAHCQAMYGLCVSNGPVGKRLDFLAQEMNREINTIGSKACDIVVSNSVVMMKESLDNIREQVRNIE